MASEQRVVELVIDASGAVAGARQSEEAVNRVDAALTRAQQSFQRQAAIYQRQLPQSVDRVSEAYDRLRGKIDPVFAAQVRAEREMTRSLATINRAVMLGVATEQQAAAVIGQLKQQQVEQINRVRDAQLAANAATRRGAANDNRLNAANVGYQFQDIAVTAAMGMNPLMIGLQQGTQLASALALMGRPIAGLASAFASLVSPVTLVTIGLTAGTAALIQYFSSLKGGARDTEEILKTHMELIRDIKGAYGEAAAGLDTYARRSAEEIGASARVAVSDARALLTEQVEDFVYDIMPSGGLFGRAAFDPAFEAFRKQITDLADQARGGNPDLKAFRDAIEQRVQENPGLRENADRLLELAAGASDAERRLRQAEAALGVIGGTASAQAAGVSELSRAIAELNRIAMPQLSEEEQARRLYEDAITRDPKSRSAQIAYDAALQRIRDRNPQVRNSDGVMVNVPVPTPRPNDLDRPRDPYLDIIKSGENRLRQLQNEQQQLGLTGAAAAELKFEQEALNEAYSRQIQLSPDQLGAIRTQAVEYGRLTEEMSRARLVQDLLFERSLLGLSQVDQQIARRMHSAGLPVDLASQEAGLMRMNALVEQQTQAWEGIRNIGRSAIDELVGSWVNGFEDIGDVAVKVVQDIAKEVLTLAFVNPLKIPIYGEGGEFFINEEGMEE